MVVLFDDDDDEEEENVPVEEEDGPVEEDFSSALDEDEEDTSSGWAPVDDELLSVEGGTAPLEEGITIDDDAIVKVIWDNFFAAPCTASAASLICAVVLPIFHGKVALGLRSLKWSISPNAASVIAGKNDGL